MRPSQASRNTSNNNSLGPPEPGEQAEKNESSLHQLDSETPAEHFATGSDGAKRRKAGSNPPTSNTLNVIQDTNASDQRTYTSYPGNGNVSGASHLLETGKPREKLGQPSDSTPSFGIKETLFTTPTSSVTTLNQPKAASNGDAIVSRVEQESQRARAPSVADSQIKSIPSSESPSFLTSLRPTSDSLICPYHKCPRQ